MAHPCLNRRCGHSAEEHLRTPELESLGDTVIWCLHCLKHEVRAAKRFWPFRRARVEVRRALPLRAV